MLSEDLQHAEFAKYGVSVTAAFEPTYFTTPPPNAQARAPAKYIALTPERQFGIGLGAGIFIG